ncbi:radical SAM protein [Spirochaetota bacterium]
MEKQSRRQFIKSLLSTAMAAMGFMAIPAFIKCRNNKFPFPVTSKSRNTKARLYKGQIQVDPDFEPAYLKLHKKGLLKKRGKKLMGILNKCKLCPRECGVNRLKRQTGFCRAPGKIMISAFNPHYGEEKPLVGNGGSGTIFMTHCGLRCAYCINWEVNHKGIGQEKTIGDMADMMLKLQKMGCHNINIVTPTHYSAQAVLALDKAAAKGLRLPLVYNTHGWERMEILKLLEGIVDVYLPDFKYFHGNMSSKYSSNAKTYPEITKAALSEMNRQVGTAKPAGDGLIYRGLMIRHLVLPNNVGGSIKVIEWIAENLPKNTYVNIMSQYRPVYRAHEFPKISRRINRKEYVEVVKSARKLGLTNLDIQGFYFF